MINIRKFTFTRILLLLTIVLPLLAACGEEASTKRQRLARQILDDPSIVLATAHSSGVNDSATARQNIADTARGGMARRSSYGGAPGGSVHLDIDLLEAMTALGRAWSYRVSEIAGGSHSSGSRHYLGKALDVDSIGGRPVNHSNPYVARFKAACVRQGATQVLGPGDPGHSTHVHCGWS